MTAPPQSVRYSLRLKVLLALILAGLCLLVTVGAGLPGLVIKRFDVQEQRRMHADTLRVRRALDTELAGLGAFVENWSAWDDTYAYVRHPNRTYETSNLVPASFESARLNLFVFLNTAGTVVHTSAYDLAANTFVPAGDLTRELLRRSAASLIPRSDTESRQGVIMLSGGPWLVAARPILTSAGHGPSAGTVVLGRRLSRAVLNDLKRDANLTLRIAQVPIQGVAAPLNPGEVRVKDPTETRLEGVMTIADLQGHPSLQVVVGAARPDHANGVLTARIILLVGLAATLLFSGLTIVLVERLILRRLGRYREQVGVIMQHGQLTTRFPVSGQDELSDLGHALNALLDETELGRARLEQLATHDELTGLPNRAHLHLALSSMIARGQPFAVALVDLDNFKAINDTLGHEVGDEVLRGSGARMQLSLPAGASVSRLGGDEFALLLPAETTEHVTVWLAALMEQLARPLPTSAAELRIQASVGVSCWPDDATDGSALLRYADLAMYHAKATAGGVAHYRPELSADAQRRSMLERSLQGVVERGELWLAYQPVVELASGQVVGCEALLRWNSPEHGAVSPAQFIPIAEERGMINGIGAWVLEEACQQAAQWQRAGLNLKVAVNVSAVQLRDPRFDEVVAATLRASGLPPSLLELEVTETAVMSNVTGATELLARVRHLGVSVALDDFGTGFASLELVRELPLDKLKLDGSFVTGAEADGRRQVIVGAVIRMARDLHLQVVAEGVESSGQRDLLTTLHCPLAQGYLYARPLTSEALLAFVRQGLAPPENRHHSNPSA
ncbi:EAL domain-containing protein [Deinococcus sp.]|uniref:putative bifunctional diguanylate cyclase/phosphodiesterase n=1 Tax=Deinococcus sp. TaxID=47478 RepID=UPI002869BB2B|nr:EAL domain-containing protein [Deinococcus sp.]